MIEDIWSGLRARSILGDFIIRGVQFGPDGKPTHYLDECWINVNLVTIYLCE